jgi:hypothetical protein
VEAFTTISLAGFRNHGPATVQLGDRWLWSRDETMGAGPSGHPIPLAPLESLPVGEQIFWGVPFDITADGGAVWVVLGNESWAELPDAVTVPVGARARQLLVCHFLDAVPTTELRPDDPDDSGAVVAEYILHYADGSRHVLPIRSRFEINPCRRAWGMEAFGAVEQDSSHTSPIVGADRDGLTGIASATRGGPTYLLTPLANPKPEVEIAAIELRATGARTITVAALTLCQLEHNPFRRSPLTHIEADIASPVEADIDLGEVVKTHPFEGGLPDDWLDRPEIGAGELLEDQPATLIDAIAARGARLTIRHSGGESGIAWDELMEKKTAATDDGLVKLRVLEDRDAWVHVRVLDKSTGQESPARVSFYGPRGQYLPPYGHQRDINVNWCEDIGGDLKLGDTSYAYIDGRFQIELPVGEVFVELTKGFEYTPTRQRITIAPGQHELTLEIDRWTDSRADGYYTGDTHVHFLDPTTSVLEAGAEDLNVVNVLAAQWGRLFTDVEHFTGGLAPASTAENLVWVGTENRHHMLGHISLLGLSEPVFPLSSGGPDEDYLGGAEEILMADWADAARGQNGLVIAPHFPSPHLELAADIAMGKIDAAELKYFPPRLDGHSIGSWYDYLNCGYRLPAVGGTDKMTNSIPVGGVRTYAHLGDDRPFTHENWRDAIRSGNTFTSTGPLLFFTAEGLPPGADINLPNGGGTLELHATAQSALPFTRIEIVANGRVIADAAADPGGRSATLSVKHEVGDSCWIAARCYGEIDLQHAWVNKVAAHTSPVYVTVGDKELFSPQVATFMLTLIEGGITYLRETATYRDADKRERHVGFFESARAELHRRLHAHGIPH